MEVQLDARTTVVLKNAAASVLVKGLAFAIAFLILPVYLQFFDDNALLGFWLAALSLVNWLLTLDMGVGNGMRNAVVVSLAKGNYDDIRKAIAGAYGSAVLISAVLAVCAGIWMFVTSRIESGGATASDPVARGLLAWLVASVLVQMVLRNITFVLYAFQKASITNVLALATSAALLAALWLSSRGVDSADPESLGPIYFACLNLPLALATFVVYWRSRRIVTSWSVREAIDEVPSAIRAGAGFMVNQILFTAMMGTTAILVAWVSGPASVVDYQAHYTLFSFAGLLSMVALAPAWSMVTKALAEGDRSWLIKFLRWAERAALLLCIVPLLTAIFAPALFSVWLQSDEVLPSAVSRLAFGVYAVGFVLHGVVATAAAGLGRLRAQRKFYLFGFIIKVLICLVLPRSSGSWAVLPLVDGVVLITYFVFERVSLRKSVAASSAQVLNN